MLYPEDTMYNLFRVYISFELLLLYDIFYFLHICFYKYAFMQTDLSMATWSLSTLSKLEHTIFLRKCIQPVYLQFAARYKSVLAQF